MNVLTTIVKGTLQFADEQLSTAGLLCVDGHLHSRFDGSFTETQNVRRRQSDSANITIMDNSENAARHL